MEQTQADTEEVEEVTPANLRSHVFITVARFNDDAK